MHMVHNVTHSTEAPDCHHSRSAQSSTRLGIHLGMLIFLPGGEGLLRSKVDTYIGTHVNYKTGVKMPLIDVLPISKRELGKGGVKTRTKTLHVVKNRDQSRGAHILTFKKAVHTPPPLRDFITCNPVKMLHQLECWEHCTNRNFFSWSRIKWYYSSVPENHIWITP